MMTRLNVVPRKKRNHMPIDYEGWKLQNCSEVNLVVRVCWIPYSGTDYDLLMGTLILKREQPLQSPSLC